MTIKCLRRRTGRIAAQAHGADRGDRGEVGVTAEPVQESAGSAGQSSTAAGDAKLARRTRQKAGVTWAEVDQKQIHKWVMTRGTSSPYG